MRAMIAHDDLVFGRRLLAHACERAASPAVVSSGGVLTYGEFARVVAALARALLDRGVGRGATVAITMRREIDHLLASAALLTLGVPQLTLASHEPHAARTKLARRAGATLVLADQPEDAVDGARWIDADATLASTRGRPDDGRLPAVGPDDPAVLFTGSGTTGEPRIFRLSQRDLALQANTRARPEGARVLRAVSIEHHNGKRSRLFALWEGATNVLASRDESLRDACARYAVTLLEAPPIAAAGLLATCRDQGALPDHVALRIGGARVPFALRREILDHVTPRMFVGYGASEVGNMAVAGPGMHDERELAGAPAPGVEFRIVEADGTEAASGEIGELQVRAPGMATAYVGDAAETARRFRDGWFLPGDLASLTTDGMLRIHGRTDDLMILNTIKIVPAEIERALELHPSVLEAAAFPIASSLHGQIPAAAVTLRGAARCDAGELLDFVRDRLGVRSPRRIAILAELPRNAQGKVLRRELVRTLAGSSD